MKNFLRSLGFITLSFVFGAAGALAVVYQAPFPDVDYDSWYGDSVNRFAQVGVLEGYEDQTYHPEDYVNRAELAVILNRFLEKVGGDLASGGVCLHGDMVYLASESYYDGCNWNTCQEDGTFVGTEVACEQEGEEKNSWEQ
ncbi:MAG: hypothetical protein ACD_28C00001G0008 [uncultured bacterium]|nr:MAG: hypothetical protein ACD_28C00001G0008 [uncultured bacterium]KKT73452.1 MAG: hypothetical protein UW70_C0083G0008 [Candidatus Peregrinibacteria bacterium GW2011_GWA2_44_7]